MDINACLLNLQLDFSYGPAQRAFGPRFHPIPGFISSWCIVLHYKWDINFYRDCMITNMLDKLATGIS